MGEQLSWWATGAEIGGRAEPPAAAAEPAAGELVASRCRNAGSVPGPIGSNRGRRNPGGAARRPACGVQAIRVDPQRRSAASGGGHVDVQEEVGLAPAAVGRRLRLVGHEAAHVRRGRADALPAGGGQFRSRKTDVPATSSGASKTTNPGENWLDVVTPPSTVVPGGSGSSAGKPPGTLPTTRSAVIATPSGPIPSDRNMRRTTSIGTLSPDAAGLRGIVARLRTTLVRVVRLVAAVDVVVSSTTATTAALIRAAEAPSAANR